MITKVIFEILSNWVLIGLAMALLFVLCYYFAIFCEKISDVISSIAKYFRARFNQP